MWKLFVPKNFTTDEINFMYQKKVQLNIDIQKTLRKILASIFQGGETEKSPNTNKTWKTWLFGNALQLLD